MSEYSLELAKKVRIDVVNMISKANSSHIGSAFSMVDLLAVLYGEVLQYDIKNPKMQSRDRLILSKGHGGASLYATLAECGFFEEEELHTYYQDGSNLSGHISHKNVNGVELSTGSLGHGLPIGAGMALAAKKRNENHKVVVILGDGECNEGSIWEAAMFSAHNQLHNLVAVVDCNKLQGLDFCENVLDMGSMAKKWEAFGFHVIEIDGHDHEAITEAFTQQLSNKKPNVVLANTIKGKGVSYMENTVLWHYRAPIGENYDIAMAELKRQE